MMSAHETEELLRDLAGGDQRTLDYYKLCWELGAKKAEIRDLKERIELLKEKVSYLERIAENSIDLTDGEIKEMLVSVGKMESWENLHPDEASEIRSMLMEKFDSLWVDVLEDYEFTREETDEEECWI